ncbi:MAG: hypothetical protein II825_01945 [Paludibacteraceae bacterium]|nr:hypothetical protein [Paludibacteraceae bacterium]
MITAKDLISIGVLKRTHDDSLPEFIFVQRDGLFVPFRSSEIASLRGEEAFVLRSDIAEEEDGLMTWQDLVGYTIEDDEAGRVGTIDYIDESTINTLATLDDGRLVPLHEDFIIDIDEANRILRVHFPFAL